MTNDPLFGGHHHTRFVRAGCAGSIGRGGWGARGAPGGQIPQRGLRPGVAGARPRHQVRPNEQTHHFQFLNTKHATPSNTLRRSLPSIRFVGFDNLGLFRCGSCICIRYILTVVSNGESMFDGKCRFSIQLWHFRSMCCGLWESKLYVFLHSFLLNAMNMFSW